MDQTSEHLLELRPIGRDVRRKVLALLEIARRRSRRSYLRRYRRKHPMKRPSLTLDLKTFQKLQAAATAHEMPLATFVTRSAESYVDHLSFPSKQVEKLLRDVMIELSRIGHNLNQWTRHIHTSQVIGQTEIEAGKAMLQELRQLLLKLREPPQPILNLSSYDRQKHEP